MCAVKYFTFSPDQLSEKVASLLQVKLTEAKIWNQKLVQSNQYRGIKIGVTTYNYKTVKNLISYCKEVTKTLKSDNPVTAPVISDKDQLSILFPDA